ncbi:MAG: hypothetical protein ISS65_07075 [Desulfobacterales bacterium]|uniref:Uncharacterized protein n=1 Tax=Candidatus Desulfatibia profunda TaxID=2841695 RepID=A0A8J6NJZ8_9BACT|nr:hypothetical protein [Candidatus Desulfatibia profunda]MBL7179958.1 hypothetical protein [Desulfobacterales bacterium]
MKDKESKALSDIEWEQRTLCPDESCIGVIGPDGRCNKCGLPLEPARPGEFTDDPVAADSEAEKEFVEDDEGEAIPDTEWEQRTLCSDESCIGVIGPDGRCQECGLPG